MSFFEKNEEFLKKMLKPDTFNLNFLRVCSSQPSDKDERRALAGTHQER